MGVREFKLPDVGEGLTEAEIVNWLVEEGDPVSEDQPVAEAETDKAVVEVPSPVNGTVKEIRAEAGEMVPVGNVIIVFETEGEDGESASESTSADDEGVSAGDTEETAGTEQAAETNGASADAEEVSTPEGRVFAAPSARRLARELGVDIAQVDGSGPGGRVNDADVRAHADSGGEADDESDAPEAPTDGVKSATKRVGDEGDSGSAGASSAQAANVESADRERTLAAPATRKLAEDEGVDLNAVPTDEERDGQAFVTPEQVTQYAEAMQAAQEADTEAVQAGTSESAEDERVPYRGIRRTIGKQMARSKYTAPHVTHHDEVDVTELVATRGDLKDVAEERGIKLTYMPFVIKAVVAGLKEFPYLNSTLDEESEEIILRKDYNVGVAVGTDAGLMVPVVKHADRKGMLQMSSEMNELVEKARERSISRTEMQDGTFTITNFGAIGGEYATPIINFPETAILGLGAIKEKPRVVDGEVVPRHVMTLSLSIDHRVIDGAQAAAFTNRVMEYLENPSLLLLE
ncbi:dihydrolipoamide acetyltransferase family protein [Halomarina oriensis]|uniref:2-oxo acid dehydrogenase subunit E2 n=1 Tax=Halomarina oriensis TaxID=671145 RepID=A0A6B0GQG8_9EURY|nr:dihydrolipoamide acetyltransferase family protein [Halomarina oriensis]MWG34913.1 2-oxo acid dehydrogenase subunit E2 [Halomarina oriensis]